MAVIGTHADFSQNDPRWSNDLLGFSAWEKMGPFGCLVDAMANVAQAQGQDFDPNTMNEALKAHGQFVRDQYGQIADIAGYQALSVVAPHSHFVEQQNWPGNVVAPYDYFDVRDTTDVEIICMLDYHPEEAGIQSHYCRVIGLNPTRNDIEIVDSFTGQRVWLSAIAARVGKQANQLIWTAGKYQRV